MASANQQLNFAVRAINEASRELKAVQDDIKGMTDTAEKGSGPLGKMGGALGNVASIAGGFVVANGLMQMPGFLTSAAQGAAEDEAATRRLEQALRNAGGAFDEHNAKINERIDAGAKLAFGDDAIRDSFQTLLAATGDVDEALQRQTLAMDLARGAGIPLEQASKLLGKVTEENVEQFKRLGITIGEGATEADAMAAVQAKFAGQADAYAASTAGQFEQTSIRMGELKEQIGAQLLPIMAKMGDLLVNDVIPKIEQFAGYWAANVQPKILAFVEWVKPKIIEFGTIVQEEFAKFQGYYENDIKPALDNVMTAVDAVVAFIREHWPEIEAIVRPVIEQVQNIVETAFGIITGILNIFIQLLGGDFAGAWNAAKDLIGVVRDYWVETIQNAFDLIKGILSGLWELGKWAVTNLRDGIASMVGSLLGYVGELPGRIIDKMGDVASFLWQKGKDLIQGMVNGMKSVSIPNPLNMVPGGGFIGKIPGFAGGVENFRGGLAIVGERGPELVSLPRGASVHSSQESRAMMSAPVNNYFTFHIAGDADEAKIERVIERHFTTGAQQWGVA